MVVSASGLVYWVYDVVPELWTDWEEGSLSARWGAEFECGLVIWFVLTNLLGMRWDWWYLDGDIWMDGQRIQEEKDLKACLDSAEPLEQAETGKDTESGESAENADTMEEVDITDARITELQTAERTESARVAARACLPPPSPPMRRAPLGPLQQRLVLPPAPLRRRPMCSP